MRVGKEIFEERNKVDNRYTSLLADVWKWMSVTENRVVEQNIWKFKNYENQARIELDKMEK
jgi:hypothetical protein